MFALPRAFLQITVNIKINTLDGIESETKSSAGVKNIKYATAQGLCLFYLQYNPIISWQKKCRRHCTVPLVSTSAYRRTLWPVAFSVIMGPFQNWSSEAKLNSCKTLLHFAEIPNLPQREMGNFADLLQFVFNVIGRQTVFIFCILYRQNSFLKKI